MSEIVFIARADVPPPPEAAEAFRAAGHQVKLAPHGLEALGALATAPVDAVCIWVDDPARDGVALARIIRERPSNAGLPVIAVAADMTCRDHLALLSAGIDVVLSPPVAARALLRAVQRRLDDPVRAPNVLAAFADYHEAIRARAARGPGTWRAYALN